MIDYFQIKYLINDCFYYEVFANNRSYEQAAGICYEAFGEYINGRGFESVVAKSAIIILKFRHKVEINKSDIDFMKYIIGKCEESFAGEFLNEEGAECFSEELEFIREKVEGLDKKIVWGVYPWCIEHGIELIHPDDIELFEKETNNCKVYECIDVGDFITLQYNNNCYRVKEVLFKAVPTPKYNFGQNITIKSSGENVVITDIMWHFDKKAHYYFVSSGMKKKSKRYFESDLM